jgi:signal transduction histidine kinase
MVTTLAGAQTIRTDVPAGDDWATQLVVTGRRRQLLCLLTRRCAGAGSVGEALSLAAQAIAEHPFDVPFAVLYRVAAEEGTAQLAGVAGVPADHPACGLCVSVGTRAATAWPLDEAMRAAAPVYVQDVEARFPGWAGGSQARAFIHRIDVAGQPAALLIAGVGSRRPLDEEHREFQEMLATAVTGAVAGACVAEERSGRAWAVAEKNRMSALLQRSRQEVEAFAHALSHDVRAPIRHIDGFVEMLEELEASSLSPEGKRLLQRFRASADGIGSLVDDLVRLSLVGRGGIQRASVNNDAVVRAVWDDQVRKAGGAFPPVLELRPLPACNADPALMRQLWENLIGNAVKFSGSREPARIVVDAWQEDGRTWYRVADNGVGFDGRYAYKLFNIFQRLHRASEFAGNGAGLAIAKKIVGLHGGSIRATGEPDRGAVFEFTIGV